MNKPRLTLVILIVFLISIGTIGRVSGNELPYSATANLREISSFVNLTNSPPDKERVMQRGGEQAALGHKAFYFAERFDVMLTPENSGRWEQGPSGRIWRLGIQSRGAYSLYLSLKALRLEGGVRLFVYNAGYKQLRGALNAPDAVAHLLNLMK